MGRAFVSIVSAVLSRRSSDPPPADREPRRDRAPHHPRLPRAGHRERRGLLRRRRPRAARRRRRSRGARSDRRRRTRATSSIAEAARRGALVGRRRDPSRATDFCPRTPRSPRACADAGLDLRRSAGRRHRADGIEDQRAAAGRRRPACRSCPARRPTISPTAASAQAIERVGLPALIKASAGGGGKGMRHVHDAAEIDESIQAARREATAAFGDGTLYVERLVAHPRHVEVQIFADDHGGVVHLFERDCSTQRRHQKVIEESPSPALTPGAARADDRGRRRRGARRQLSQRRHDRVPASRDGDARVLLPRDEHAAAGRASGHRAGHRPRSGARAAARRHRRAAAVDAGRRSASAATPSKRASTPRIRRRASSRRPARLTALSRAAAARHPRRLRRRRRRRGLGLLRPDDRQGDRHRRNARRSRSRGCRPRCASSRSPASRPTARS